MKPTLAFIQKGLLLIAGTLLILISLSILLSPQDFYAASGIEVTGNTSLLNELKAPAGLLFVAGLFIASSIFTVTQADKALGSAALIYLSYAFARLLSMLLDGVPSTGLVQAASLEIFIGTACVAMLLYRKHSTRELAPC